MRQGLPDAPQGRKLDRHPGNVCPSTDKQLDTAMKVLGSGVGFAAILAALGPSAAEAEILIGTAAQITGDYSWLGEQVERGARMAVDDLNSTGGVLHEQIRLILVDDYCRGDQAVAAARKLVDAGVVFVAGHPCSGAAIPASKVYEEAGILMISSTASNPRLTDKGGPNIFRVAGRDDQIGRIAGHSLADRWGDAEIAILHDGQAYGKGLAEEVKTQLNERGVHEAMYEAIAPGQLAYIDVILKMKAAGVDVLYYAGYSTEAALLIRQARGQGYDLQLVSGDALYTEQFWLVAGSAGEGALFTSPPDPREDPEAVEVVRRFRAANYEPEGGTLHTYASIQVWAQAVEKAGTTELDAVIEALRSHAFDTVVGRIRFDDNGDVTGTETYIWYVWKDGQYGPARPH
jgi:branched-chain amino acid transport system substrate-binding protein